MLFRFVHWETVELESYAEALWRLSANNRLSEEQSQEYYEVRAEFWRREYGYRD